MTTQIVRARWWTLAGLIAASAWGGAGCASASGEPTGETLQSSEPVDERVASESAALTEASSPVLEFSRSVIAGDVYRYTFLIRVGSAPNARLRVTRVVRERSPFVPRATTSAIMLLHGDFATFTTNFAPTPGAPAGSAAPEGGLGVYLANRNVDVWGVDRRWTTAPAEGADTSDFSAMTFGQELTDIGRALAFARLTRGATGSGAGRVLLGGFSRGGQLAYEYAAAESQKPPVARHVRGLVPIDVYARIAPGDEALRQSACESAAYERDALAAGVVDSDNGFFIELGTLAATHPDDPSPFFPSPGPTNRGALLSVMGQTYQFVPLTPVYHLAGTVLHGDTPTSFRFTSQAAIERWLITAPFHQALAESADGDAIWCNEAPRPVADHLAAIAVPLYYLGAAGGFGDHGLYTTTLVASTDVTTHVVRRLDAARESEDFGHGDLLFSAQAPERAWRPLARWIATH